MAHTHTLPTHHGGSGVRPNQGTIITLGATNASVPTLRRGSNSSAVFAASNCVGPVSPMPCMYNHCNRLVDKSRWAREPNAHCTVSLSAVWSCQRICLNKTIENRQQAASSREQTAANALIFTCVCCTRVMASSSCLLTYQFLFTPLSCMHPLALPPLILCFRLAPYHSQRVGCI